MYYDRQIITELANREDLAKLGFTADSLTGFDLALLGYQRTKHISKGARLAWQDGDHAPLLQEVRQRGQEIFDGALLDAYREYIPLREFLRLRRRTPKSVIDIGCGQAVPDLFLQRDFKPRFTLVDIEETQEQFHFWAEKGSGYASLDSAQALLCGNGAAKNHVRTLNPLKEPGTLETLSADLVTSFYSCGFHYPVGEYLEIMLDTLNDGGLVCLDMRGHYLKRMPDELKQLEEAGGMTVLFEDRRAKRVIYG